LLTRNGCEAMHSRCYAPMARRDARIEKNNITSGGVGSAVFGGAGANGAGDAGTNSPIMSLIAVAGLHPGGVRCEVGRDR
jgi:hypothetical protein